MKASDIRLVALIVCIGAPSSLALAQTSGTQPSGSEASGTQPATTDDQAVESGEAPPADSVPVPAETPTNPPSSVPPGSSATPTSQQPAPAAQDDATVADPTTVTTTTAAAPPAAPAAASALPKYAWRNSFLYLDTGATFTSFFPGALPTYNPYVYTTVGARLRWYFEDTWFMGVGLDLFTELTSPDASARRWDPQFSDLTISFVRPALFRAGNLSYTPAARAVLPISVLSRSQNRVLALGLNNTFGYPIPELNLNLQASVNLTYSFNTTNIGNVENPTPGVPYRAGTTIPEWIVALTPTIIWAPDEKLSLSVSYSFATWHGRSLKTANVETLTGNLVIPDQSGTHFRFTQSFSVSAAYDVAAWLNVSLNYYNSAGIAGLYAPDGSFFSSTYSPFHSLDSAFSVTAIATLDNLYNELAGIREETDPETLRRIRNGQARRDRNAGF